jgi:DNA-binding NarL/FixJ family response regulator
MKPLRILIADDHEMVRRGLQSVLATQPGWEVCGEAITGRDAVELAERLRPDILILDIAMPELNGLEVARRLHRSLSRCQILILTMHESEELVRDVLAAGARGYVLKNDAGRVLVQAIQTLSRGKPYFTSQVAEIVLDCYLAPADLAESGTTGEGLTTREREIVQLVTEGRSNKEAAENLKISVRTVETHRANLMRKLRLRSASELTRWAIRNHIIEP